jgi:hypothetical protein
MNRNVNRAEVLWRNWEEKRQQLENMPELATEGSLAIKKQQYDFLRQGLYRLSVNPAENEKLLIQVIQTVTDKLQKQLYPNPVIRLLQRLKAAVYDKPQYLRRFSGQREANLDRLKGQLKSLGFASFNSKLENYLDFETNRVKISLTQQMDKNVRLDFKLDMERDQSGAYQFSRYDAMLKKDGEASRSFTFLPQNGIAATEAANLLDGRAIRKGFEMADGGRHFKWVQLGQNNVKENGSLQLQEYHEGKSLKNELQHFAKQTGVTGLSREEMVSGLEAGNKLTFRVRDKGPYYLQADPAGPKLSLFDKDHQPMELSKLLKETKIQQAPVVRPVKSQEKNIQQSFGIGQ